MNAVLRVCRLALLAACLLGAESNAREKTILLSETRKLIIDVPEELSSALEKDESGIVSLQLKDPHDRVSGEIRFLPDPDGRFAAARARMELMNETFGEYVESSTEKGMQFEELEPQTGAGTYCVFTDASLVGKPKPATGEYLHVTTGVKAWPGVVAIFRIFSQDTTSAAYRAAMKMLRESVEERPVPMK